MAWIKTKTVIAAFGVGTLLAGAAILTLHEQEQQNREREEKSARKKIKFGRRRNKAILSPQKRTELEARLNQLRAQQNQLRTKQSQLYEQDPNPFAHPSTRLSPFTKVRYQRRPLKSSSHVFRCGIRIECHQRFVCRGDARLLPRSMQDLWQKRFGEDLVIVLSDMGHAINTAEKTVDLTLTDFKTGERKTVRRGQVDIGKQGSCSPGRVVGIESSSLKPIKGDSEISGFRLKPARGLIPWAELSYD